jgi:hypothetical protein
MATLLDVPDEVWDATPLHERNRSVFYGQLLPYTRLWTAARWTAIATVASLALLALVDFVILAGVR